MRNHYVLEWKFSWTKLLLLNFKTDLATPFDYKNLEFRSDLCSLHLCLV